jgi:hypothetical protein
MRLLQKRSVTAKWKRFRGLLELTQPCAKTFAQECVPSARPNAILCI